MWSWFVPPWNEMPAFHPAHRTLLAEPQPLWASVFSLIIGWVDKTIIEKTYAKDLARFQASIVCSKIMNNLYYR